MSCTSLTALPRACGAKGIEAGLDKLYMVSYEDLAPATGATHGEVYVTATNGMVSAIGLDSGKKFVAIGLLKDTSDVSLKLTKDVTKGISYFTNTLKFVLSELTTENKTFVESVMNQPVAILFRSRTGKYYFAGGNGRFELTAGEGGIGMKSDDLNGITLTFEGADSTMVSLVDDSIVSGLI